jgi:hypothetical protein
MVHSMYTYTVDFTFYQLSSLAIRYNSFSLLPSTGYPAAARRNLIRFGIAFNSYSLALSALFRGCRTMFDT